MRYCVLATEPVDPAPPDYAKAPTYVRVVDNDSRLEAAIVALPEILRKVRRPRRIFVNRRVRAFAKGFTLTEMKWHRVKFVDFWVGEGWGNPLLQEPYRLDAETMLLYDGSVVVADARRIASYG